MQLCLRYSRTIYDNRADTIMADDIIDRLLRIQNQDLQITERERELAELPAYEKKIADSLQSVHAAIADVKEKRTTAQLQVKESELEINDARQKMIRLREQQMTLKTNREFRTMEDEIGTAEKLVGQLETQLLENMETVDKLSNEISDLQKELSRAEEKASEEKAGLAARSRQAEEDLDKLRQQRAVAAQTIPKEWLSFYERLFNGKRDRVLVTVDGGICDGCHMKVPPAVTHAARRSEALVTCDFCGRMLYSEKRMA